MSTGVAMSQIPEAGDAFAGLADLGSLQELLRDGGRQAVVLGSSKDPNAKVTVLLIPAGGDRPTLAVKVPTTDVAALAVEAETRVLARLHRGRPDPILETVPRPAGTVVALGRRALAVSVLPGGPMATSYHRWRHTARPRAVAADFAAAATWLARFQDATEVGSAEISDAAALCRLIQERFGAGQQLAGALDALGAIDRRLSGQTTLRCAVHGDYWFGNLLVEGRGGPVRGVVDWEGGAVAGSPLRDLARFPLSYALYLDRHTHPGRPVSGHPGLRAGAWGAGLRYAIQGDGWFPRLFRRFLDDGLERLGVEGVDASELAMMGLAEVAVSADHDGFARDHLLLLTELAEARP